MASSNCLISCIVTGFLRPLTTHRLYRVITDSTMTLSGCDISNASLTSSGWGILKLIIGNRLRSGSDKCLSSFIVMNTIKLSRLALTSTFGKDILPVCKKSSRKASALCRDLSHSSRTSIALRPSDVIFATSTSLPSCSSTPLMVDSLGSIF